MLKDFTLPPDAVMGSAKCAELARLLPELKARGSRVLLFSQWTQVRGGLPDGQWADGRVALWGPACCLRAGALTLG